MATINPHTTRATGTVLTAAIYNTDHQNHITNANSLNTELGGVADVGASTGIIASNGLGTIFGRSIEVTNGLTVANANGVTGNPSIGVNDLFSSDNTSSFQVSGGNANGVGAQIEVFGGLHATLPNQALYDAVSHTFRSQDGVTQLALLNASGLSVGGTFVGSTVGAILAPTVAGTIFLRPNTNASTVGQTTIATTGAMTVGGILTAVGSFISSTATAILATTGAGTIFLRPNGNASTVGQVQVDSTGNVTINGTLTVTG